MTSAFWKAGIKRITVGWLRRALRLYEAQLQEAA